MSNDLLEYPTDKLLVQIDEKILHNQLLDAYALSQQVSLPLYRWPQGWARKVAAHLYEALGDSRRSCLLDWMNWRADRDNDRYYYLALYSRLSLKTTYELIPEIEARIQRKKGLMLVADEVSLNGFLAWCYSTLHDFEKAHQCLQEGLRLDETSSWLHVQQSIVLERQDRYETALEAALQAVSLRPTYRPAVSQLARIYMLLGRDEEAMDILKNAHQLTQNASFIIELQSFYSERDMHEECIQCLDEAERLLPLRSQFYKEWLAGRRADFAYIAGDMEGFRRFASLVESGFHKKVLENFLLSDAAEPFRVKLEVPFIRQHKMTCAPATLASLARYWGKEADHLEIADSICYDGTPWHKERCWAEKHGFVTREFRVTRPILFALIDRGIPFTLTTESVTSAHLQACIGYDRRLDVILLRDPTNRHYGEMLISALLDEHPLGPRGMVLVPKEREELLQGLYFPEEAAFDALHDLSIALDENDRLKADAAQVLMRAVSGDSPLQWDASYRYHSKFGNLQAQWTAMDHLLQQFPDNPSFSLIQMSVLNRMHKPKEQREMAEKIFLTAKHAAVFDSEYGEILLEDARDLAKAERILLRAMRRQWTQGHVYESLARCREKQRQFDEVVRLRKVASCLSPSSEMYARAFFESCRAVARTEEALLYLHGRVTTMGKKDAGPWLTLANAYQSLMRQQEARTIMEKGLLQLPKDGSLLCRYGSMMLKWGEQDREKGIEMIRSARDKMPEYLWFQEMAFAHSFVGQRINAIHFWENLLKVQPLSVTAYGQLVSLMADEQGVEHAMLFLQQSCSQQPTLIGLWTLLAEWQVFLQDLGVKATLDHILELDHDHVWALRERSGCLLKQGHGEASLNDAREALEKAPYQSESYGVLANVLRELGKDEEADEALRSALRINIDYTWAASMLMSKAKGLGDQKQKLDFIYQQMMDQVSQGEIVTEYQSLAYPLLEPTMLLDQLRDFCNLRSDLWQTWSARKLQCQAMNLTEESMECSTTMTESFPLLPRSWSELADIHHLEGRYEEECSALRKALDLSPAWDWVARRLAAAMERLQQYSAAEQILLRMINVEPLASQNYADLASLLDKLSRTPEALALMQKCVSMIPLSRNGWERYATIAQKMGCEEQVLTELQSCSSKHQHRADWWFVAAETCSQLDRSDLVIDYSRRGLAIQPKHHDLRDLLVRHLTYTCEYDEAKKCCLASVGHEPPSREMEGRYCWVLLRSGKAVEAIERMEKLLLKEPDYVWVMSLLASCRLQRAQWQELKTLAQQWIRMDPRSEMAYGYLGNALVKLNDKLKAMQAFQQAVNLDPSDHYACRQLFDLQLENKQFEQARQTLVHLQHYLPGAATICDEMDLLIVEKKYEQAIQLLDSLLQQKDMVPSQLQWLRDRMLAAYRGEFFSRWLQTYMTSKQPLHKAPVMVWVESMVKRNQSAKCAKQIERLPLSDESRTHAWVTLIEATNEIEKISLLNRWVNRHRVYFSSQSLIWNAVGYSFANMRAFKNAAEWLKEWNTRDDATDVTYNNVALSLDVIADIHSGDGPRRKVLQRFPNSHLLPPMMAKLAICDIINDQREHAEILMANVELSQISKASHMVAFLANSMLNCTKDQEYARRQYGEAIEIFRQYSADQALKNYLLAAEKYIVSQLPQCKGEVVKLRKIWGLNTSHPLGAGFFGFSRISLVTMLIIVYLLFYWLYQLF
jgi:cellulose synthase operon protein C